MTATMRDPQTMTKPELAAELDEAGIEYAKTAPKASLVDLVIGARSRAAEPPEEHTEAAEPAEEPEVVAGEVEAVEEAKEAASTALVLREQSKQPMSLLPTVAEFNAMMVVADRIASTQMVPKAYRGKPDDVVAAILTGREMGLGPMESLREIFVLDGKPSLSANLLMKRMRERGVRVLEQGATRDRAWIRAQRQDTGEICEVEWTMEEAAQVRTSGKLLISKDNWQNYPADMLYARCVGRLARRFGSDLIGSVMPYASEEVEDWEDESAPQPRQRQQASTRPEPKNWKQIGEWIAPYGPTIGWRVWTEQAAAAMFHVETIAWKDLTSEQKGPLGVAAAQATANLVETCAPGTLPEPTRAQIQAAWAKPLDGVILPGPEWSLSPVEAAEGRPDYYAVTGEPRPEGPTGAATEPASAPEPEPEQMTMTAEEQAAADAIPFGEPDPDEPVEAEWTPVEPEDDPPSGPNDYNDYP